LVTNGTATGPRRRVLLKDVARSANVSGSTASRALADDPRISLATRLTVKAAAAELNYVPNAAARSLRMRHTLTLGLLIPDLRDPVHGQVASGFEEEARRSGYCVIMVAGENEPVRERLALKIFAEHGADGVAIVSSAISPREARERVDPERLVLVQPDHNSLPRREGVLTPGVILTDDATGMRAAVNHLLDNGYRRIAFVEGGGGASSRVRSEAVAATLRSRGVRTALRTFAATGDTWRDPTDLAAEIAADLPEALVCYDDKLALALLDSLRKLKVRVPEDIGIVGFDGIPFAAISNPRLTTVATPAGEMGRLAAASLIRAIQVGARPEAILLSPELIVRESTRIATAPRGLLLRIPPNASRRR
jgi:DNA-binding LacI/PurR family transcriptional regulator